MFKDRYDAGKKLAKELQRRDIYLKDPLVVALPKGGVPVAYCVAEELGFPLESISLKKIGAPYNPELAIGAVSEDGEVFYNEELLSHYEISFSKREKLKERAQEEAMEQAEELWGKRRPTELKGKDIILVDDGIATGATVNAAIKLLRKKGVDQIILAVPVCSLRIWKQLITEVDFGVVLEEPRSFLAVGQWYEHFEQTSYEEARELLSSAQSVRKEFDTSTSESKKTTIPFPGGKLQASAYVPKDPKAWIIFVHGSASSHQSPRNQWVAKQLYREGFASLLFDLLTSEEDEADNTNRFDIDLLAKRLKIATEWLGHQKFYKPGLGIAYFGASTGAAAAIATAVQSDPQNRPYAIVSRGGRPDLAGEENLQKLNIPTLLLVGGHDYQVIELNQRASRLLRSGKLELIRGATHLFEEPGALEEVAEKASDWFTEHIPAAGEIFHRYYQQNSRAP